MVGEDGKRGRRNPGPKWPHNTGCFVSLGPTSIWERKKLSFSLCLWLLGPLYHSNLAFNIKIDTCKWGTSNRILKHMAFHKQSDNWQWRNRIFRKTDDPFNTIAKCLVEILPSQLGSLTIFLWQNFSGSIWEEPENKCMMVGPCWL